MVVDPHSAAYFIAGYKSLLAEVHRQSGSEPYDQVLEMLAAAREAVNANPALINAAATSLEATGQAIPPDVLHAAKTLRLKQWVFLRDTTTYSVFIEPDGNEAYAVLGLTDRIRDIVGGSAVAIKAGVVEYRGRYVCDGIVGSLIWLGSNLKKEFNATLSHLKKNGRLHVVCEP
jgi:hypothetical protein